MTHIIQYNKRWTYNDSFGFFLITNTIKQKQQKNQPIKLVIKKKMFICRANKRDSLSV